MQKFSPNLLKKVSTKMRNQVKILNIPIDAVSQTQAKERLIEFLDGSSLKQVYTPNPEIIMIAQKDQALKNVLQGADLVIPDGIGLIIASKIKGLQLKERVTGIDTMHQLLLDAAERNKSIYLFGGKPGIAEIACENIENKYKGIRIAGFNHGYFKEEDENQIINNINSVKPDILFVCLGAPKQEKWIYKYKEILQCKIAMGVGGSVDIYSGTAKRAPRIFQKMGLEWFYRLAKEPWRLKRMMLLPKFLLKVITTK